jgi:hypothetical protein
MKRAPVFAVVALIACACAKPAETGADGCPKNEVEAVGKSCAPEGKTCGTNPSGFTHFIMCSGGKWSEMEAPPPPPAK